VRDSNPFPPGSQIFGFADTTGERRMTLSVNVRRDDPVVVHLLLAAVGAGNRYSRGEPYKLPDKRRLLPSSAKQVARMNRWPAGRDYSRLASSLLKRSRRAFFSGSGSQHASTPASAIARNRSSGTAS
jgi:hypothetical protein